MKNTIKIFATGLVLSIVISPLRSGFVNIFGLTGFPLSAIVGFLIYFFMTIYFLKKHQKKLSNSRVVLSFALGISLISLTIDIYHFPYTLASLLETLIQLSSVFFAWLVYRIKNRYYQIPTLVLSFALCFVSSTTGYELWLNKLKSGSFTGKVESIHTSDNVIVQNMKGDTLALSSLKAEYLLVDCWNTTCGICYREMKNVQKLHDKYRDNPSIRVITLHARMEKNNEIHDTGAEILKREGYTLPTLSINISDPNLKELGVTAYPTVLIFNKDGKLVFRGNIDYGEKYLQAAVSEKTQKAH